MTETVDHGERAALPRQGTQAVDRAIAVLRSFESAAQLTVTEIAHRLGLTTSTAHRIVRALHAAGMLGQDPVTERYFLGPSVAILGRLALERMGSTLLHPELIALRDRTGEAVSLGVRVGDEVAVLLHEQSPHPLRYDQEPGARNPVHVCAMGKTLLAFGDRRVAMAEPFRRYTPATITTRAELEAELARIRRRGYAINNEERIVGVRAVAAPVRDHSGRTIAAVALQGPAVRFGDDRLPELAAAVRAAADRLTALHRGG
ncbi:IclR family transcriptional regulator [Thermomonospora catenispora]|uniref:IclR family transcriptional regulator n=1 Tax=Thermomonospora catenispora TaxID=2493090 RepID=UPI001121924F|nr:IclR family transcriptional regulator [Thermomonospora catenispora]TNY35949.1 IclR family transcriptional regulator [Thermomonospora catenispora]